MLPVLEGRAPVVVSRAPVPVAAPTPAPTPVVNRLGVTAVPVLPQPRIPTAPPATILPQPASPVAVPPPIPAPVMAPAPAPTISALSGQPIQTSIFQPNQTPATVANQIDTEFTAPTASSLPAAQVAEPQVGTITAAPPVAQSGYIFGIDQNTFWVIVLLAIAVLVMVTL